MPTLRRAVLGALFGCGLAACAMIGPARAADGLRPQVGKPLQEAGQLLQQQKFHEALDRIAQADAAKDKTPYEDFIIERMRGAAAAGAGEVPVAAQAFDRVLATGRLAPEDAQKLMLAMVDLGYRARDYATTQAWALRYRQAGGSDPGATQLLIQSYYLGGRYADAARELQAQLRAEHAAGRKPTEAALQMLADSCNRLHDAPGYLQALQALVRDYPGKAYWTELIAQVQRSPGFSDRLSLDVYRLLKATGTLEKPDEYMELAQLALQAGYPLEAQQALDQGYAAKVLGQGTEAARQARLKALVARQAAADRRTLDAARPTQAEAMVNTGFNLVLAGRQDQGLALMQQGLEHAGLVRPQLARLHLGEALAIAGHGAEARKALRGVQGGEGAQKLAAMWLLQLGGG